MQQTTAAIKKESQPGMTETLPGG